MNMPAKKWTAGEKLRVVVEASKLSDDVLGEFLRREGLHAASVDEWRALAEGSLVDVSRRTKPVLGGKGRRHDQQERAMTVQAINDADRQRRRPTS